MVRGRGWHRGSSRAVGAIGAAVVVVGTTSACSVIENFGKESTPVAATSATPSASASATGSDGATPSGSDASPSGTPSPTSFASLQDAFDQVSSGVVRLEVAGCEADSMGTGFAITPDLVVTAAHVVEGANLVRAITGDVARSASVLGVDRQTDVALLRVVVPVQGYQFRFSDTPARVGDPVAALGFPQASLLTFTPGTVNGVGRKASIDGVARFGLVEFDAATHPGSSGGPVIRQDGTVIGLVHAGPQAAQGRRLAVAAATAQKTIRPWLSRTSPVPTARCPVALGPDGQPVPASVAPGSSGAQALGTLRLYFASINQGDYSTALAQFVNPLPLQEFQAGVESSQDGDFVVRSVRPSGQQVVVWLTFTSRQQAGNGPAGRPQETCTDWSLDYVMAPHNGLWLIDKVRAHGTASRPCANPSPAG